MKTTKKQIIEWCQSNIDECGYGVDVSEMATRCFRCGCNKPTEKCHVIPDSLGGADEPFNYRLLCHECHLEAPNVNDPNALDDWIRETNVVVYDVFWQLRKIYKECYDECIIHWGERNLNESTRRWLINQWHTKVIEQLGAWNPSFPNALRL